MIQRCYNSKCNVYKWYGARGIRVCRRWRVFKNFIADMGPRPSDEHQLDRVDSNGNYEPSNCRWVTMLAQKRNTRKCMRWHIKGHVYESCWQAAETLGVNHSTIRNWVLLGKHGSYAERLYK